MWHDRYVVGCCCVDVVCVLTSLYALTTCETISFSGRFPVSLNLSNASTISLLLNDLFSMLQLSLRLLSMLLSLHNVLKLQMSSFRRCRGDMMNGVKI